MDTVTHDELRDLARARRVAEARYRAAIRLAREQGWNNTQIARVLGLTEGAIRLYLRRHPELHTSECGREAS